MKDILFSLSTEELFILHFMISITIATATTTLLKNRYNTHLLWLFILLFSINLVIPILGYLFTLTLTTILIVVKKRHYLHSVETFNHEEFLKNSFPQVRRIFGEGAISSLATDTQNHSPNKMKGLVFMANHPSKKNFSLIKGLLSDANNEIRLYSFSVLANAEGELNDKISHALQIFNSTIDSYKKAKLASELAFYYWEFIHYGLSDKETNKFIMEKVTYYANFALKHHFESGELYTLLGKNAFLQKAYVDASTYFHKALKLGIKKSTIAPYLAEISYNNRKFKEVTTLLREINPLETSTLTAPLLAQWTKR
jgi:hypothetical protein